MTLALHTRQIETAEQRAASSLVTLLGNLQLKPLKPMQGVATACPARAEEPVGLDRPEHERRDRQDTLPVSSNALSSAPSSPRVRDTRSEDAPSRYRRTPPSAKGRITPSV